MNEKIRQINPGGLFKNSAFSQIVTTYGNGKAIYIGGQNAVNANREIIGKGDIAAQKEQVMQNIQIALNSCGANFENIVKLSIHTVQGQNGFTTFHASQKFMNSETAPAITILMVAGLANPDFLIEIDAVAFLPE